MDPVQLLINASIIGAAVGYLRWGQVQNARDISQIKKALGLENGDSGAFVRREEWELDIEMRQQRSSRVDQDLRDIRQRIGG